MTFILCADFSIFPDNHQLGPAFILASIDFHDVPGDSTSFVNETLGERGLQFPNTGLDVDLPIPVPWVRLRVGQFASPYTIEGLGPRGNVIAAFNMNFPNSYRFVRLHGPNLSSLRFRGGGHKGIIVSICALIPCP